VSVGSMLSPDTTPSWYAERNHKPRRSKTVPVAATEARHENQAARGVFIVSFVGYS
jgi:hypothetical protein